MTKVTRSLLTGLAAVGLLAAGATTARADELDKKLFRLADTMFEKIGEKNAKAVGVLKFRAQKGTEAETFNAGPINASMAERLEAVLIFGRLQLDSPVQIVRGASDTVALAGKHLNYLNPADRKGIFGLTYTDVEKKQAEPGLFFTGVVKLDHKTKTTTVVVEALDRATGKIEKVGEVTAPNERSTLSDFGQAYVLARRSLLTQRETELNAEADKKADELSELGSAANPSLSKDRLADIKMFIDGEAVDIVPDADAPGRLKTNRKPRAGQKVHFVLENVNPTAERLAVVLRVNGENTLSREKFEAKDCRKWILEPGKPLKVEGFHVADDGPENMQRFAVKAREDIEPMSSALVGVINFHVFVEGSGEAASETAKALTTRGLRASGGSYAELTRGLNRDPRISRRSVIVAGEAAQGLKLESLEFKNPTEQAHLYIQYMKD